MEPGIVQYYEQRNGNPAGIPVVHIGVNLQANQDAQTDNFIRQAGFKTVANDVNRALASRFQSSGQPIFVVINGVANSPSHKQWQLLVNQNGYGTTQHPIESFRAAIDQVRAPAPPSPRLSDIRLGPGGTVEFTLNGEAGRTYRIEVSANLVDWLALDLVTTTSATWTIRDIPGSNIPHRFYRVVTP